jgi:hypothetical protein
MRYSIECVKVKQKESELIRLHAHDCTHTSISMSVSMYSTYIKNLNMCIVPEKGLDLSVCHIVLSSSQCNDNIVPRS